MNYNRQFLGTVDMMANTDAERMEPMIRENFTDLDEYSRFKFGDGLVGAKYGTLLGSLAVSDGESFLSTDEVLVGSSAYRIAPPASESLVQPFIAVANVTAQRAGLNTHFSHFKVSKARLVADNYANMTFEERAATLQDDLILPPELELEGRRVIMLDDIRVTGLREQALVRLLETAGVDRTDFYYVLNVPNGNEHPQTEAIINKRAVRNVEDVIKLANQPAFVPNVRLCKFIVSQPIDELERFCAAVPRSVFETVLRYIESDDLRSVVRFVP
jgi:hypothetical protein